jgi:hypothetical protein
MGKRVRRRGDGGVSLDALVLAVASAIRLTSVASVYEAIEPDTPTTFRAQSS